MLKQNGENISSQNVNLIPQQTINFMYFLVPDQMNPVIKTFVALNIYFASSEGYYSGELRSNFVNS